MGFTILLSPRARSGRFRGTGLSKPAWWGLRFSFSEKDSQRAGGQRGIVLGDWRGPSYGKNSRENRTL